MDARGRTRTGPPRGEPTEIDDVADAVDALLDRSIGAEKYVIRAAADSVDPDPLIDLSQINFDSLAAEFAGRKRTETERYVSLLKQGLSQPPGVSRAYPNWFSVLR